MIRLHNARIMPMSSDCSVFEGELWTDGGKISYVGPAVKEGLPQFEREIDLGGDLVIPGFKNAHAHSAMTFLRSFADDLPLQSWLFDKVFPLEDRLTPEAVYAFTRLAVLEYISGGITASFDMYFHRDAYAQANIDSGFRTVICGALSAGDKISIAADDYKKYNAMGELIGYLPGVQRQTGQRYCPAGPLRQPRREARRRHGRPCLEQRPRHVPRDVSGLRAAKARALRRGGLPGREHPDGGLLRRREGHGP